MLRLPLIPHFKFPITQEGNQLPCDGVYAHPSDLVGCRYWGPCVQRPAEPYDSSRIRPTRCTLSAHYGALWRILAHGRWKNVVLFQRMSFPRFGTVRAFSVGRYIWGIARYRISNRSKSDNLVPVVENLLIYEFDQRIKPPSELQNVDCFSWKKSPWSTPDAKMW